MVKHILIMVAVNLFFYIRLIRYGYIIDDQLVPKRKVPNLFHRFWLQLTCNGYSNPAVEHFQRIVVHFINAILIYILFGKNNVSFFAALLWSINPITNQGVAWLNGVGYSVSTMLTLLMFMFPYVSFIFLFATLWWHLTAAAAPVMFLFMGYPVFSLLIGVIPIVGYLVHWQIPFGKSAKDATLKNRLGLRAKDFKKVYLKKFIFVAKTYAYYCFLSLIPMRLGLFHTFLYSFGITDEDSELWQKPDGKFFLSLLLILTNIFLVIKFWGTPLSFGIIWFTVLIAQWCNVIILHQTISDRYCYLPSIGLMYALSWSIYTYAPHKMFFLGMFFAYYATRLVWYLRGFRDMDHYVEMNIMEQPDNFAAWNWRGILAREKGWLFTAIYSWSLGLRYKPNDFRLNFNLAFALKTLGLYDMAEQHLQKAKKGMPENILKDYAAHLEAEENDLLRRAGMRGQGNIIVTRQMPTSDNLKKGFVDPMKKVDFGKDFKI